MRLLRGGPFQRRGTATFALLVVVGVGLVLVFAGTLSRSSDLGGEAAQARAEFEALSQRVAEGRAEVEFLESEAFVDQVARSIGWGSRGERPFALAANAPSPAPIVPLGSEPIDVAEVAPLEAWLELLFGA